MIRVMRVRAEEEKEEIRLGIVLVITMAQDRESERNDCS